MFKYLGLIFVMCISFAFAQEGEGSGMEKFLEKWYWLVGLGIVVVEYLIGISKMKANSMLEMFFAFLKGLKPKK